MAILRDMLIWLGLDASEISNLKILVGLFIGFILLVAAAYGAYLLSLLAARIAHEHRLSKEKARAATAQANIEAQRKEGEARVFRAQTDARGIQEEQRLQEIKDGPNREAKRLREEVATIKKQLDERNRVLDEKDQTIEAVEAAKADMEGKYEIQEQQIKSLMVDISGLKTEYRDMEAQRDDYKTRAATAEAVAAVATAEAVRREAALCDLGVIRTGVEQLVTRTPAAST